jgi:hypothetical protein
MERKERNALKLKSGFRTTFVVFFLVILVLKGSYRWSPGDTRFSDNSETVASVILGNPGEQPAFSFQINTPGVDSIWQTAYVCSPKSSVQLVFSF